MKKLLFFPILIILLIAGAGCRRSPRRLEPFGWTPLDAEFDSQTVRIDRFYEARGPRDSFRMAIEELMKMAQKHPDNQQLQARAKFWNGLLVFSQQDFDRGYAMMEEALEMTDSARYPYDWHRIAWTLDMDYHEPTLGRYEHLVDELDFFLDHGDAMVAGALAMELGCFLNDLGDLEEGMPYLRMADSLFATGGWQDQIDNNRINYAQALSNKRDTLGALALDRSILADTVRRVTPYARDILLGNIYAFSGDTAALREAYLLALGNPLEPEALGMYRTFLAQEKMKVGQLDSARHYMQLATESLPDVERPDVKLEYYRMRSQLAEREGRVDTAYKYMKMVSVLADSVNSSNKDVEIRNAMVANEIAKARMQADIDRRRLQMVELSVIFGLIILIVIGGVIFYRHVQRRRLEKVKSDLDLERSSRRMLAMELVLKEKETLFRSLTEETCKLREAGEISASGANRLTSALKIHGASKAERENFMDTFDKIDSAFTERIRADYPSLTDTDVRLAAFVALGLDNKHIARVMGIRPESVKQARWRLRSKLSLPAGSSLEEAVRPYLN